MKEYLDAQAAKTAIPTPAQAEAGNYRKGRVKAHGLPIVIETARGAMRRGIGRDGKPWAVRSPAHYGYISRTEGADGDHVDVYIGPHLKSKKVYVLDQLRADSGRFDEHKCFLGFTSPRQVLAMYRKAFSDGKADARFGKLMEMSPEQFRDWLAKADTTKPIHRADGGRVNYADGGDIADGVFGTARDYMLETGADRPELFDPYAQETAAYLRDNNGTWGQRARKAASDFGGYLWDAGKNIAGAPVKIAADPSSVAPFVGRLTGTMGYEREQTWPEKMIRSGTTLPGDVYAGREQMWDPETNHTADRIIERTQDLAGLAGGSSFAAPAEEASLRSGVSRPVRAARESLHDTADANFIYGTVGKNETVPIDSLNGAYLSKSPLDQSRVAYLKNSISGPDGYVERLIVDGQGNVIEGQHRLAALQELGVDRVPISRIRDLAEGFNVSTIEDAVRAAGVGHPDQVHGVVKGALEAVWEYGSPQKALAETEMPGAWQKPYESALRAMVVSSDSGKPGAAVAGLRRSALPMDEASRMARAAEMGYEGPWYHGSERTDRLTDKGKIDPRRATSGPMAFFTDNPEVASNYAKSKADTSLNYDLDVGVQDYFHVSPKQLGINGRAPLTVEQSWHYLPRDVQQDILSKAKRVGHENPDTASGPYTLHDYDATLSPDHFDYLMKTSARGNPLKALREMWHDGGELVGNETAMTDIYRLAGYPYQISEAAAPWTQANGVMPARIRMQNPLHTDNQQLMIETVLPRLEEVFKRDRSRKKEFGADDWDKNTRWTPREWIQQAKEDYAKGDNSFVWTSIPDKITNALRSMGYDGVIDTGGKMGGQGHRVAVPFGPEQVRSQFARFDPKDLGKSGLLLSDSGQPGSAIAAMANADGKITRLPSPQSLQALPHPSLQNMKDFSRLESVPLSDVRTMQDGRGGMNWEANKRGEYAAPLMKEYADKPVAVRKETGEYVIIDGNHRTVNAINRGDKSLEMHVIDAKKYAPHAAGIKPSRSGAKWGKDDDEILRELGVGMTNRARGGAVEHMADGGAPGGDGWVDVPDEKSSDWVDVPNIQSSTANEKPSFLQKLGETWPARLAKDAYSAIKLPGDVYQGNVSMWGEDGHTNPEVIKRATDLAAFSPLGTPIPLRLRRGISEVPQPNTIGDFNVPLTRGEAAGDFNSRVIEQRALRGGMGNPAQRVAQDFMDLRNQRLEDVRGGIGRELDQFGQNVADSPSAGADLAAQAIRTEADRAKRGAQNLYDEAFARPGEFDPEAFRGIGNGIRQRLSAGTDPVIVDEKLTPVAARALQDIDENIGHLRIRNDADPMGAPNPADIVGVNLRGVDQARKRLVSLAKGAQAYPPTPDTRAMQAIIGAFDGEIENAIQAGLFRGDPEVIDLLRNARGAWSDYRKTFFPQFGGDDVGRAVQKIIGRAPGYEATPTEVANYLYGATSVGAKGSSVRLAQRVRSILGENSPEWSAVRQGVWDRMTTPTEARLDWGPQKQSERIYEFLNGSGRPFAEAVFTPDERTLMRRYADLLRRMVPPPGAVNYSNNVPMLNKIVDHADHVVGATIGAKIGGIHGAAIGYGAGKGTSFLRNMANARQVAKLMPTLERSMRDWQRAQAVANRAGLPSSPATAAASANLARVAAQLGMDYSAVLSGLTGAVKAGADEEQKKP